MRILQVVPRYAPAWAYGGGVRITYELARAWVANGHNVTVFTSDQQDAQRRFPELETRLDGIQVRRFRNPSHRLAARYSFLFFHPMGLAQALRSVAGQYDVIHVAESRGRHNQWVDRAASLTHIPVVWSAYGGLADGEGIRRIYRRLYDRVFNTRKIVCRAAGLIAQTSHEVEVYRQFGARPEKIRVIPLAVNWSDFASLPAPGKFRRSLGLDESHQLVVFVGRVHWTKGLQVLVPAFAQAAKLHPQARLAIVGWDHGFLTEARKAAAALGIADKVHFPGPLYGADRFHAYVDADVFALTPGVYEETSLAALEACGCGTGCVITEQCEIPGLEAAGAGRMVPYGVEPVASALNQALTGDIAVAWGDKARSMVQERFTAKIVGAMHEKFFEDVCGAAAMISRPL